MTNNVTSPVKIRRTDSAWRWGLMRRHLVTLDGKYFLKRLVVAQCPWFAVLLTKICRPDLDRDPHTHYRSFMSVILSGGYEEDVFTDPDDLDCNHSTSHGRWSAHILRHTEAHSITSITRPLWTLVLAGPMNGEFCFWTPDGTVNWRDYERDDARRL